jgi:hypothetical protein
MGRNLPNDDRVRRGKKKVENNWKEIEVTHKKGGCVPNTLFDLSDTAIGLKESKHTSVWSVALHEVPRLRSGCG